MKRDIYRISIHAELQIRTTMGVQEMQNKSQMTQKQSKMSCAGCGKIFKRNEKTVSYDFERYYCFKCDDNRSTERYS